ncbi:DUF305 domain-containing protein [Saccharomonospora azurea]|uniref:DUF305 domain-containing protein n=1 Tax=Saccharomonospora azurea TaxID=40988 RepID=UPI0009E3DCE5|nr:DUF305 domain-containing protein [Saccharomonospora azurea]
MLQLRESLTSARRSRAGRSPRDFAQPGVASPRSRSTAAHPADQPQHSPSASSCSPCLPKLGREPCGSAGRGGEQTLRRIEGLEGEDFDLLMSTNFIRHHLTLLPRADRCTDVAFHEKLRALCDTMYQGQLREIETLTEIIEDHIPR